MDMDQIRTFLEVVEAGSFVRAAESLSVTQSTVSARIKELETEASRLATQARTLLGDVDGDLMVNARDALWVLWVDAQIMGPPKKWGGNLPNEYSGSLAFSMASDT